MRKLRFFYNEKKFCLLPVKRHRYDPNVIRRSAFARKNRYAQEVTFFVSISFTNVTS